MRPLDTEIAVLQQMGLLKNCSARGDSVVPNMLHPLVQWFYRDKPSPQMLDVKSTLTKAIPKPNIGRGLATKFVEPQSISAAQTLSFGNFVNSSLDPRLQARNASSTNFSIQKPTTLVMTGTAVPYKTHATTSIHTLEDKAENVVQELEDEVMKLKMDNIMKDREIRRLRAENEQMRGKSYETGNKRPCI